MGPLFRASIRFNSALVGFTSVTGWILTLAVIGVLVATGQIPVCDAADLAAPAGPVTPSRASPTAT